MATVSANFERIGGALKQAVDDRDWRALAALAALAPAGAILSTSIGGVGLNILGMGGQEQTMWGRLANGSLKVLAGLTLGVVGAALGGPLALAGAIGAVGGIVVGGGDFYAALLDLDIIDRLLGGDGGTQALPSGGDNALSVANGGGATANAGQVETSTQQTQSQSRPQTQMQSQSQSRSSGTTYR